MKDTEPTAEYIRDYYKRQQERYGGQAAIDQWMLDMYLQENLISAKAPAVDGVQVTRVKAGLAGLTVDQDVSVLSGDARSHVTVRGNEEHAEMLEAFTDGSFHIMEEEDPVRDPGTQDLRVFGRIVSLGPIPDPKLWGDDELKKLAEEMSETDDPKEYAEKDKAVEEYKKNCYPIIWQHIPADSFFPTFLRGRELAECVWVKKMHRDDVEAEFPGIVKGGKEDEIEVLEYANQRFCATVLATSTPQRVRLWEHGMKVAGRKIVPVSFEEVDRLPANPQGWFWKGSLFHVRGLLEAYDETLTDVRTNIREFGTTPPYVKLNMEARSQLDGWPSKLEVDPKKTLNLLADEEVGRVPVPQITTDAYSFLGLVKGLADQVAVNRPALQGTGPSGQSAVNLATSNAIGKAELKRPHRSLERWLTKSARLIFASVIALNEKYPDVPDAVTVRHRDSQKRSKEIAVKPSDVKDYFHMIEVNVDLNLPITQGADVQNASVGIQAGVVDPLTAREMFMRMENPTQVDERWAEWKLRQSAVSIINAMMIQRLTASAQAGQLPVEELINQSYSIPEAAQQALMQALEEDGVNPTALTGNVARGANNEARTGRDQRMSDLAGMDQELPA